MRLPPLAASGAAAAAVLLLWTSPSPTLATAPCVSASGEALTLEVSAVFVDGVQAPDAGFPEAELAILSPSGAVSASMVDPTTRSTRVISARPQ